MNRIRYLDIDELNDRLKELESLEDDIAKAKDDLDEYVAEHGEDDGSQELDALKSALESAEDSFTAEEREELQELRDLKDEVGESRGKISTDGGPFIDARDFEDYARGFAEEIGALDRRATWPMNFIDWEFAAKELAMDYSVVTFRGTDYYYRA